MGRRVLQRFGAVITSSYDDALMNYDAADRDLVGRKRFFGLLQRLIHESLVEFDFARHGINHTILFMSIIMKNQTDYSGCDGASIFIYKLIVRRLLVAGKLENECIR